MEPFNLEEYLKNPDRKVVTRDGRNARIICTDAKGMYPIVALVASKEGTLEVEHSFLYYADGRIVGNIKNGHDLFFAPEKKEGWINIYKDNYSERISSMIIYSSKKDAKMKASGIDNYITTIKIEWEE